MAAKHNRKPQCGGKKTRLPTRKKKPSAVRKISCKTMQHHAKTCAICKRKMQKKKHHSSCGKNPTIYQLFVSYITKRMRNKDPNVQQCVVMKYAANCWKKLTDQQKAHFKQRCDSGEIKPNKTGGGSNTGVPPSCGNPGNGGNCGGCCKSHVHFQSPSFPTSWKCHMSQTPPLPSFELPSSLQTSRHPPLFPQYHMTPTLKTNSFPRYFSSSYVSTGKSFP